MRTNPSLPSGFQCTDPDDIDRLNQTDDLHPARHARSRPPSGALTGTKTIAWSQDCSYFAWPYGGGTIKLVPWDNRKNRIVTNEEETESGEEDVEDCNVLNLQISRNDNINDLEKLKNPKGPNKRQDERRKTRVIHCKENVWSVAFGSGSTTEMFSLMWRRFKLDRGLLLATGHQNGNIKVWDCNTGKLLLMLKDHKDIVKSLDFAPDGSLILISGSRDGTVKFWDFNDDGNMYKSLRCNTKWVYDAKWSPKCDMVASVGTGGKSVILWNILDNYKPLHLTGHYHDVVGCCFSPDGALLATASLDTRVLLWDVYTGQSLHEVGHMFPPPRPIFASGANDFYVRGISFHPHGQMIVTINDDGYVRCWNLENENDPTHIAEHQNAFVCSFSPQGHRISVGDKDGCVKFYQTPAKIARLQHLCRMSIRNSIPSTKVDYLHLPFRLKEYLKYHQF